MVSISIGICGCIHVYDSDNPYPNAIALIDSDKLAGIYNVIYVRMGLITYTYYQVFLGLTQFVSSLNTTFVALIGLHGTFYVKGRQIFYSNPEKFITAEIMAIYGTRLLVYKFGTPTDAPIIPYTASLGNGDIIPGLELNGKILSIRINSDNLEMTTYNIVGQDSTTKDITFTRIYSDCNIWVEIADDIPSILSFDYTFPFPLS